MGEDLYEVCFDDTGRALAKCMRLEDALLFTKAIFEKYYMEDKLGVIIRKEHDKKKKE